MNDNHYYSCLCGNGIERKGKERNGWKKNKISIAIDMPSTLNIYRTLFYYV